MILAIETALKSGSLAILNDEKILCSRVFGEVISMSKSLLSGIEELLNEGGLNKADLKAIAVSNGPGSLTGIRIGISVGMGLALALGIKCVGVSLLKAFSMAGGQNQIITIVPAGKNESYWQFFDAETEGEIGLIKNESVPELSLKHSQAVFVVQKDLLEKIKFSFDTFNLISPDNAAELIGQVGKQSLKSGLLHNPSPIYVQENLFKILSS